MKTKSGVEFEVVEGVMGNLKVLLHHPKMGEIFCDAPRKVPRTGPVTCGRVYMKKLKKTVEVKLDLDTRNRKELQKVLEDAKKIVKKERRDSYQFLIDKLPEFPQNFQRGGLSLGGIEKLQEEIKELGRQERGYPDPGDWSLQYGCTVQRRKLLKKLKKECPHKRITYKDELAFTRDGRQKVTRYWKCPDCGSEWIQSEDTPLSEDQIWR